MAGSRARVVGTKKQVVRSEVLAINSMGQAIGPEARNVDPRGRAIRLGAPIAGLGGLRDGLRVKIVDVSRVSRVHLYSLFL